MWVMILAREFLGALHGFEHGDGSVLLQHRPDLHDDHQYVQLSGNCSPTLLYLAQQLA